MGLVVRACPRIVAVALTCTRRVATAPLILGRLLFALGPVPFLRRLRVSRLSRRRPRRSPGGASPLHYGTRAGSGTLLTTGTGRRRPPTRLILTLILCPLVPELKEGLLPLVTNRAPGQGLQQLVQVTNTGGGALLRPFKHLVDHVVHELGIRRQRHSHVGPPDGHLPAKKLELDQVLRPAATDQSGLLKVPVLDPETGQPPGRLRKTQGGIYHRHRTVLQGSTRTEVRSISGAGHLRGRRTRQVNPGTPRSQRRNHFLGGNRKNRNRGTRQDDAGSRRRLQHWRRPDNKPGRSTWRRRRRGTNSTSLPTRLEEAPASGLNHGHRERKSSRRRSRRSPQLGLTRKSRLQLDVVRRRRVEPDGHPTATIAPLRLLGTHVSLEGPIQRRLQQPEPDHVVQEGLALPEAGRQEAGSQLVPEEEQQHLGEDPEHRPVTALLVPARSSQDGLLRAHHPVRNGVPPVLPRRLQERIQELPDERDTGRREPLGRLKKVRVRGHSRVIPHSGDLV